LPVANEVYKIGTNSNHPLFYTCCNFKLLKEKTTEYLLLIANKQVAAIDEKDE